jgi:hypothetical protein
MRVTWAGPEVRPTWALATWLKQRTAAPVMAMIRLAVARVPLT